MAGAAFWMSFTFWASAKVMTLAVAVLSSQVKPTGVTCGLRPRRGMLSVARCRSPRNPRASEGSWEGCQFITAFATSIHKDMGLFSKTDDYNRIFRRNERVVAAYDLPGVPERTSGKIKMVSGFEWQRYWVFFDNGVHLGSLDGSALLRPHHWERWRSEREDVMAEMQARMEAAVAEQEALQAMAEGGQAALPESAASAAGGGGDGAGDGETGGGGARGDEAGDGSAGAEAGGSATGGADAVGSGVGASDEAAALLAKLPEHLVERSRSARARLGG